MTTAYINDEWTLVDQLGYADFVTQLRVVIDTARPPFTLGIYGGWGSGKTSIMRQLFFQMGGHVSSVLLPNAERPEQELLGAGAKKMIAEWRKQGASQNKQDVPVWFNPWQHQFEDEPIIGLLHEIRENFNLFSKATQEARKLADVTVRSGLGILCGLIKQLTKVKVEPDKIEKYGTQYEAHNLDVKSSSERFRLLFEKAVEKLTPKGGRLVVFIDDLDRCVDDNIFKLIEGIKLYLSSSNCIFVFGLDQMNVIRALEKRGIRKDYVDKLFQSVMRIPLSKNYEPFIRSIVDTYFEGADSDPIASVLADILEKNPRKVKNFLNSFRAHWELTKDRKSLSVTVAALFHYLRSYHEPVFTVLERSPEYFPQLVDVCRNNPPNQKAGHFFYEHLKNPIAEMAAVAMAETEELVPESVEKEELDLMKELLLRYDCLEKFKQYFVQTFDEELSKMDESAILKYLGVIGHEG